jgi:hypothetical protein
VASCGAFSVSVAKSGTYSGRVQISTNRYAFTGRLDVQCRASNIIPRSGNSSLVLGLEVGTGENAGNISGSLTDGNWLANLSGERAAFDSVKSPAPLAGNYTIAFPGVDADSTLPAGDGFGTLRIFRGGLTVFAGSLADGTPVSYSTAVSTSSLWQVYAPLYGGKGALAGKPSLNNLANTADLGPVTWMKLANPSARFYHAGFTNQINALGSAYVAPSGSGRVLSLTNGSVQFTSGNLAGDFTDAVAIWPRGRLTGLSDTGLNLTISPGTGTLRGNVVHPASGQRLTVNGAVLQNLDAGFGFLLGTNLSSRVRIGP